MRRREGRWDLRNKRGAVCFGFCSSACFVSAAMAMSAAAQNAPGVTDREIKIGQTMPYTGPGAWASAVGVAEKAYMQMINDQGGINGRKINLISADDGYLPWRTGNETRKLVEVEQVAFTFGSIGTPTQSPRSRIISTREKFRSCSSRAARTAGAITRRRPTRSAACARATDWERVFMPDIFSGENPNARISYPL